MFTGHIIPDLLPYPKGVVGLLLLVDGLEVMMEGVETNLFHDSLSSNQGMLPVRGREEVSG